MDLVQYRDREIEVTVVPLADGGFGVLHLAVWRRGGPFDSRTPLHVIEPMTFATEAEAEREAIQMAMAAIDNGTAWRGSSPRPWRYLESLRQRPSKIQTVRRVGVGFANS